MNFSILKRTLLFAVSLGLCVGCSASPATQTPAVSYKNELRAAVIDPARALADFTVASTTGADFTLSEHRGEVILIYFGYRTCPDVCPNTFSQLRLAYRELNQPADKLKIVFVTIDPERDSLEYMSQYIANFSEDFVGLRAEGQALQQLEQEFGVIAERKVVGDSALSYLFDHTASIFLIGTTGQLEGQYLYGTSYHDIVHDLQLIFEAA